MRFGARINLAPAILKDKFGGRTLRLAAPNSKLNEMTNTYPKRKPLLKKSGFAFHKFSFPKGWNEFVKDKEKYQNLIIKSRKNKCHCTNCGKEFISSKKINETMKCPNCKNKYLIKRSNLRYYEFKDYLSLLKKINNTFVIC